jgi:Fur family zinc uptake transcriptional regulator
MAHDHACTDPKHHVHDGDAFVHEVERACEQRGLRLTPIRANALRLIADAGRPVKAYELLDLMKATHDAAAPPTVYRALDFLLEHGFIHKLSSINAYVGCHHPGGEAHAVPFLICDNCQSATELEDDSIVDSLDAAARAAGFAPQAQTLEVHGLCANCAGAGVA